MNERSKKISKLLGDRKSREDYIRSKLNVLLPSQIRSLRLRRGLKQSELGQVADMKQARVSAMERVGDAKYTIETLVRLAAAFSVGIHVEFVTFSEMLAWENEFEPDTFDVVALGDDKQFLQPGEVEDLTEIRGGILSAIIEADYQTNVLRHSQISEPNYAIANGDLGLYPLGNQNCASNGVAA